MARHATSAGRRSRSARNETSRSVRLVNRKVEGAASNPWFTRLARLGYVVRGVLYGTMGVLAMGLAVGGSGGTTDQTGALDLLGGEIFGRLVLIIVIVALAAYSLWGFIRAIYDPLGRGSGPTGVAARVGFVWSGLNYGALMVLAVGLLVGTAKPKSSDSVQRIVETVLAHPGGGVLIIVAGSIGVLAGLGQFVYAYRAGFKKDLKRNTMSWLQRMAADSLGRYGMVARGVIFTLTGCFILDAGLHHNASDAHGFGVAFQTVARAPLGRLLLGVVALGFVALGLHSVANARWIRMPKQRTGR